MCWSMYHPTLPPFLTEFLAVAPNMLSAYVRMSRAHDGRTVWRRISFRHVVTFATKFDIGSKRYAVPLCRKYPQQNALMLTIDVRPDGRSYVAAFTGQMSASDVTRTLSELPLKGTNAAANSRPTWLSITEFTDGAPSKKTTMAPCSSILSRIWFLAGVLRHFCRSPTINTTLPYPMRLHANVVRGNRNEYVNESPSQLDEKTAYRLCDWFPANTTRHGVDNITS